MVDNPFTRILQAYADRPADERQRAVTQAIGETIPFVGTAGLTVDTYTPTRVTARLTNRPAVQNHIGGVHAAAMALLAETVTGLVVALNVPGESAPVLRALDVSFERPAAPPLQATATLSDEEAARIQAAPIGKVDVPVAVDDAAGPAPFTCRPKWAWVPTDRLDRASA